MLLGLLAAGWPWPFAWFLELMMVKVLVSVFWQLLLAPSPAKGPERAQYPPWGSSSPGVPPQPAQRHLLETDNGSSVASSGDRDMGIPPGLLWWLTCCGGSGDQAHGVGTLKMTAETLKGTEGTPTSSRARQASS